MNKNLKLIKNLEYNSHKFETLVEKTGHKTAINATIVRLFSHFAGIL